MSVSLALVVIEQHVAELLEALPNGMDVGKILEHNLTVWVVI